MMFFFLFKQKTAYEMRISDWSSDVCSSDLFVQQGLHDAFLARLVEKTKSLKIGDPMDPATQVGALISKEHCEKVLGYIERGRQEGAEIAAGGGRPADPALARGNFVEPTVFAGCRDDMAKIGRAPV